MNDPLFYFWFATAYAALLDFCLGDEKLLRTQSALNGYKEGLSRHIRNPSYSQQMINQACNIIKQFGSGNEDQGWLEENTKFFKPVV